MFLHFSGVHDARGAWHVPSREGLQKVVHAPEADSAISKGGAKRVPKSESHCKNCIWLCRTDEQKGGAKLSFGTPMANFGTPDTPLDPPMIC